MSYMGKKGIYRILFFISIAVLFAAVILSSTVGAANITFIEALKILSAKLPALGTFFSSSLDDTHKLIVLNIRLPRILLAAVVGTGLSVVGAAMQGMFKNPMADPGVIGVSSGAALGATIAIASGFQKFIFGIGLVTLASFLGAIATTIIVYSIAKVGGKLPTANLLLSGVAVSFLFSSVTSIIMIFKHDQIQNIVMWTMGSLSAASWKQLEVIAPAVIFGSIIVLAFSRDLNLLSTGNDTAKSLGVEAENVKKLLLVISSLLIGACVSVSGIIGFVGLVIPHVIRLVLGSDHRVVLPFSAIGGALFLVICDTLARNLIPPAEIPVGAITSLFGAPFFIYLLVKSKKKVMA